MPAKHLTYSRENAESMFASPVAKVNERHVPSQMNSRFQGNDVEIVRCGRSVKSSTTVFISCASAPQFYVWHGR
jgi:hypothetical protein